jgi:hypothetical protein
MVNGEGVVKREGRGGGLEAVYLVRGSILSLSFIEPNNRIDLGDQIDQLPATRREMYDCTT